MQKSAAATRAEKLEHRTSELTQPAGTSSRGNPEGRPIVEVTKVTEAEPGSIGDHGMTPLMYAACDGLAGTVQALLDRGAELNAKRSDGFNALALAAFFGHSQVVWLLLENGADLAAIGRSETLPERWADCRGFFDIGDTLREARLTEQGGVSSLGTAVIDESARFSRSAEKQEPQRAGDPGTAVETAMIDEAIDSEATLAMRPEPAADESTTTKSEWTADLLPTDNPGHPLHQPAIAQPLRPAKTLREIEDPPHLAAPAFHPGSAFVARITSSRKNLVALIVVLWLVCGGTAAFLFPQLRKSLGERRTEGVTNTPNFEPTNPAAESGTNVSGKVETPSAPATEPSTAPASKGIEETAADSTIDSKRVDSAGVTEKGAAAAGEFESRAHPSSDNGVSDASREKHDSAATSVSRSGTRSRKQRAVSRAVKLKPQTVGDELPKPAPLAVETGQSRSVLAPPVSSANEAPSGQPSPFIFSGKPKSKVIQWP